MIETEQGLEIDAAIDDVWAYVSDIANWAAMMPGYRECTIVDGDESLWTLKVGVGGLLRTVKARVHVDRWAGPEEVDFHYALEGDPVTGGGTFRAQALDAGRTSIALQVQVTGSGPMAPMWEAMGRPLLPQFAKSFAGQLKAEIEKLDVPEVADEADSGGLGKRIRGLFGRKSDENGA